MTNSLPAAVDDAAPVTGVSVTDFSRCRAHVLQRISETQGNTWPFEHAFIENIFPADYYAALRAQMLAFKHSDKVSERHQDNPLYVNKRYNLVEDYSDVIGCFRRVFSDREVKQAILRKFYRVPSAALADALAIHEEFEFVFTEAGRFQNIHIDIPPKFLSLVFYIPEHPVTPEQEERNATILYDKELKPHYLARFKANSVCTFVPQFSSYHGFSSTIDRDALVMFYVNGDALRQWQSIRKAAKDQPPFTGLLDAIEQKLKDHPLMSFDEEGRRLAEERAACLVNAPQGRVLVDEHGKPLPKDTHPE